MSKISIGDLVTHSYSTSMVGRVLDIQRSKFPYSYKVKWLGSLPTDWYRRDVLVKEES